MKRIVKKEVPYIIAEIGSNWKDTYNKDINRDIKNCKTCIDVSKSLGASAVKFQLYDSNALYGLEPYKVPGYSSSFDLPRDFVPELAEHCKNVKIDFLCTAFNLDGFKFINEFVKMHKIASSSISNDRLVDAVMGSGKPFLWSDGMNNLKVIPKESIRMMCASAYPAHIWDYDLPSLNEVAYIDRPWGLSDHTQSFDLAKAIRAYGGTYFEKHFNPLYFVDTPDTKVSVSPLEFKIYIEEIKKVEVGNHLMLKQKASKKWADYYDKDMKRFVRPKPI